VVSSSRPAIGSSTPAWRRGFTNCGGGSPAYDFTIRGKDQVAISSSEISDVIKRRLKDFDAQIVSADVGRIVTVGDGIARSTAWPAP